ncbi:CDP-diacylglycerol--glycerol-3-phosphate 3-phosphatidyltransferase [Thioflexithrix psekupsensis]|uniref:CDP-diacylglycerol--glycerol-3-phosphate 3-phosphatidyltransferase n=1 Tax=Thioflexithrix psekupsensis TaxID=1570016 RepID=A0A251XA07_9GAMM|nr:CDP-diacylglycerol--glycerol-3-phosphate 3-phosphatidyltransferase [Thioflexithrix psekupsensis]OUD15014.1 CDP-diacylglycerol--glycerol-3-phosphate 3-phosphatidyltransferase [Thioflexithrix psekupsensis]
MNIPIFLTLLRVALIPVLMVVFYLPLGYWANFLSTAIFAVAALTDWFDGYLARRWQQTSQFGAFLDPVADKLIVAAALILLVEANPSPWLAVPTVVIIGREIAISALREWMAELGERTQVAVSYIGKIKTTLQMIALLMLLYHYPIWFLPIYEMGMILLYIAAGLTLWSMLIYLKAALPILLRDVNRRP